MICRNWQIDEQNTQIKAYDAETKRLQANAERFVARANSRYRNGNSRSGAWTRATLCANEPLRQLVEYEQPQLPGLE